MGIAILLYLQFSYIWSFITFFDCSRSSSAPYKSFPEPVSKSFYTAGSFSQSYGGRGTDNYRSTAAASSNYGTASLGSMAPSR